MAQTIVDSSRAAMFAAWGFALFWNAIAWVGTVGALRDLRDWRLAVVAIFPVVGVGLLVWAVRATLHYRKFGRSSLALEGETIVGRALRGTVSVPAGLPPGTTYDVTLRRVERRTSGSGKNRSTTETIQWEEHATVAGSFDGRTTTIPVAFRIPASEPPTAGGASDRTRMLWRLCIAADMPGLDYSAQFEVPVVRTALSDTPPTAEEAALLPPLRDPAAYRPPRSSRIVVSANRRGTEIVFPAARNPGPATSLTLFLLVWTGAVAIMLVADAPLLFPIVFGVVGLVLLAAALQMWFGVSRVEAAPGAVTVTRGLFGGGRPRTFTAAEIAEVAVGIGMQAGNTPYYDVRLVRRNGRKVTAGGGVRDKAEAEWLAHTIREAIES